MKTQFLTRPNCPISTIYTVEYFLEVILSSYRFKRDNFLSENVILILKCVYKMATIVKQAQIMAIWRQTGRLRLGPLPPNIHAEDCWTQWEQ